MIRIWRLMLYFLAGLKHVKGIINRATIFIFPNLTKIIRHQLLVNGMPAVQQLVMITGEGIVSIGTNCFFGYVLGGFHKYGYIEFQARYKNSKIVIGNGVATNNNVFICAANYIEIGENTLIGQNVTMMDFEAHGTLPTKRRNIGTIGRILLGKNVWVGNNVIILKDSNIGENTIVAAGAVVSGSFPANVIIGGVPAKIIKYIENV
jgi:acetyltransferase-like isoleucine patch superfamily enzyme